MHERSIFAEALEKHDLSERAAYLDEVCGGDDKLRNRIAVLLRSYDDAGSFLEQPPQDILPTIAIGHGDTVDEGLGEISLDFLEVCDTPDRLGKLGQYEAIEVLGRGGMGIVLRAHDTKLNRVVAIKVMAPELAANPMAVKRFLREAEAAAAVSHDHVVAIHAIEDEVSPPYIVMEFVDGLSLQEKIDNSGALELREILRIGMQTASGLAAAHKQGLVHRDIKPANILLENGIERVKITDFGLARAVDDVNITRTGVIAGTPQYMSPEQAQGDSIDHRSDLFALGSVLYAMCTGRAAFRADNPMAVMRRVCDDEPRDIQEINADTPDWLCAIIEKLLGKDADERFQTAEEVSELLAKWLAHGQQPALIPAPEQIERARSAVGHTSDQSIKKHIPSTYGGRSSTWPIFTAMALCLLLLIGGVFGVVVYLATNNGTLVVEADDPKFELAIKQEDRLIRITGDERQAENSIPVKLRVGEYDIEIIGSASKMELSTNKVTIRRGEQVVVRVELQKAQPVTQTAPMVLVRKLPGHKRFIDAVVFTPEGDHIVTGSNDKTLRIWETVSGKMLATLPMEEPVSSVAVSPNGKYLAAGLHRTHIVLWDLDSRREVRRFIGHELGDTKSKLGRILSVNFSADGSRLISGGDDATVRIWDVESGRQLHNLSETGKQIQTVQFSPDGNTVLGADYGDCVTLWNSETGKFITKFPGTNKHADFSPDGRWIAAGMWILDAKSHARVRRLQSGPVDAISFVQYTPDGRFIAMARRDDRTLRLFEAASGREVAKVQSDRHVTMKLAVSPDGRHVVTGGGVYWDPDTKEIVTDGDYAARLWRLPGDEPLTQLVDGLTKVRDLRGHSDAIQDLEVTRNGKFLISAGAGEIIVRDAKTQKIVQTINTERKRTRVITTNPDGTLLATGGHDGTLEIYDLESGGRNTQVDLKRQWIEYMDWSPDGKSIVMKFLRHPGGGFAVWDVAEERIVRSFESGGQRMMYSPNSRWVATGERNGKATIYDAASGRKHKTIQQTAKGRCRVLAFSPDSQHVLIGDDTDSARMWDVESGELQKTFGHGGGVHAGAFLPDGRHIITGQKDARKLCLWNLATGQLITSVGDVDVTPHGFALFPDGGTVATAPAIFQIPDEPGEPGIIQIWRLPVVRAGRIGWQQLFNGRDLSGWQVHPDQPRGWRVEDSLLIGDGGAAGHLFTEYGAYDDFHLRAEVKINDHGNGGVYFRCTSDLTRLKGNYPAGYEAQILNGTYISPKGGRETQMTGSLYDMDRVERQIVPPDEWFTLEIIARDNHIVIKVNGETTAEYIDSERTHTRGHIALQQMPPGRGRKPTVVQFRKIEIKDLNEPAVEFSYEGDLDQVGCYLGHTDWISHVAYTSDGGRIVTSGYDETIRAWDASSGKMLKTIDTHNTPLAITLSPDDRFVVAGMYQANVVMWDLETGKIVRPFVGHEVPKVEGLPGRMLSVAFSPNGKTLASCGDDGTVRLWNVESGKQLHKLAALVDLPADLPVPPVETVVFSSDGKTVLASDYSGTVTQWNVTDGRLIKTLRGQKHAAISPDGQWIVAGHKLFNSETNEPVRHLPYEKGGKVSSVRFTPDSRHVVIGKSDGSLWVYDVPAGRVVAKVRCNKHVTNVISVSPDGEHIASGGGAYWSREEQRAIPDGDYALRVWRLPEENAPHVEFTEVGRCQGHERSIFRVAYAPNGNLVYSVDGDTLRQWNAATGELVRTIDVPEGSGWASSVAISPDSKHIFAGHAQGKLTLWNAESGELVRQWAPHEFRVDCVAFTPDGKHAVSACATHFAEGDAGPVKVYQTSDWEVAREFHVGSGGDVYGLAIHPDSRHVLLSPAGPLQLRNLETGELVRTLDDDARTQRRGVAIDETGQWALTGSNNSQMVLWDLATGEEVRRFRGHGHNGPQVDGGGIIARVAFVPETNWIVSSGWDRTLRLWNRDTGVEIARDTADSQSNQHVAVSPDGRHLVTGGGNAKVADGKYEGDGDYELRIWRLPKGSEDFAAINLQPNANVALMEGAREENHLGELGIGNHTLGGIPFVVDGKYIQLGGGVLSNVKRYPPQVVGIAVHSHVGRLHFLHATQHTIAVDDESEAGKLKIVDGVPLAKYIIHYDDETQEVIPVIHGEDIRDWWNWDSSKPCIRGLEVWHGSNPTIRKDLKDTTLRLFLTSWTNPHPENRITSIDYQRANGVLADPFCVAITREIPIEAKHNTSDESIVLPPIDGDAGDPGPSVIVNVLKGGTITYLGEQVSVERLSTRVAPLLKDNPEIEILIRADREVKHNRVVEIISALRELGVDRVSLAAEVWSDVMQAERLKQIGVAFHQYHDEFRCFPPAAATDDKGEPLLSWRVHLLPFIDEMELYEQFHLDEPWDSEHNAKLLKKMPLSYGTPLLVKNGETSLMVVTGDDALFGGKKAAARDRVLERYRKTQAVEPGNDRGREDDKGDPAAGEPDKKRRPKGGPQMFAMTDGTLNTILLVQAGVDKAVPWTKPEDVAFDPKNPTASLGKPGKNGWLAVFGDAAVHVLPADIKPLTLQRLINPADGNAVDFPKRKSERTDLDNSQSNGTSSETRRATDQARRLEEIERREKIEAWLQKQTEAGNVREVKISAGALFSFGQPVTEPDIGLPANRRSVRQYQLQLPAREEIKWRQMIEVLQKHNVKFSVVDE